jgi:hypothetical protein
MMHFDEHGKHVKSGDIHNSNVDGSIDRLSKHSNGSCKSICLQYRSPTSRYENNQKRCKKCDIFITLEGTKGAEGLFCKCCNIRVSGVPSKSLYKENYHNQEQNKTTQNEPESFSDEHKPWYDFTEDHQNMSDDASNEKKSSPVYDEIDESVKTFYEFQDFLEDNLKPQANYQFVMLHELLNYGKLHKGEIAESLAYFNNKNTTDVDEVKYYFGVPVFDVLVNHGFVTKHDPSEFDVPLPHYSLNVKFEEMQRIRLLEYLSNQITKYNQEHNIPENEFPESNNMENFNWRNKYAKSNIKSNIESKPSEPILNTDEKISPRIKNTDKFRNCTRCNAKTIPLWDKRPLCRNCAVHKKIQNTDDDNSNTKKTILLKRSSDGIILTEYVETNSIEISTGQILSNDDLMDSFGVGNMGGIRYSRKNNLVILLSTHSDDYDDTIDSDSGLIIYTGEGKYDQELKNGNEKILNSQNTPMVYFKEVYQEPGVRKRGALDNIYEFVGVVKYQKHYWKTEKNRKVIKFILEIVS